MKRCPQCNFSQPDDTYDFCPKCGSKLEIVIKQEDSPRQETEQLSPKKNVSASAIIGGIIVAIAVVILLVAIIASISQSKGSSSGSSMVSNSGVSTEDAQWAVYLMAQQQVPNYIASPSTMKFCVFSKCEIKNVGGYSWKGSGYFDSENMYGAEVRSTWNIICTIKDGKIHMAKLEINDSVAYNDGTQ